MEVAMALAGGGQGRAGPTNGPKGDGVSRTNCLPTPGHRHRGRWIEDGGRVDVETKWDSGSHGDAADGEGCRFGRARGVRRSRKALADGRWAKQVDAGGERSRVNQRDSSELAPSGQGCAVGVQSSAGRGSSGLQAARFEGRWSRVEVEIRVLLGGKTAES